MTVSELKTQILSNSLGSFYIFYGEEYYVQRVYISKIAEQTNSDIQMIDSLEEIKSNSGLSLFEGRTCFVCVDNTEILKSNDFVKDFEKLSQILGNNLLILQFSKLDKRSKFYNFITKGSDLPFKSFEAVEFEPLHSVVLQKHIRQELDVLPMTAQKLAEVCEFDYGRCLLEINKIKNFDVAAENNNLAFKTLLDSGIIYQPPGDKIFDFVDAVLGRKSKLAFSLLQDCNDIGEPALRLLLVLFNSVKHLLQVQACDGNIEKSTGLNGWEIKKMQRFSGVYRNSQLVNAMKLIRKVEVGIKTGTIDEQMAVEYVLVNML